MCRRVRVCVCCRLVRVLLWPRWEIITLTNLLDTRAVHDRSELCTAVLCISTLLHVSGCAIEQHVSYVYISAYAQYWSVHKHARSRVRMSWLCDTVSDRLIAHRHIRHGSACVVRPSSVHWLCWMTTQNAPNMLVCDRRRRGYRMRGPSNDIITQEKSAII